MQGTSRVSAIQLVRNDLLCALGLCSDYLLQAVLSLWVSKVRATMNWRVEMKSNVRANISLLIL